MGVRDICLLGCSSESGSSRQFYLHLTANLGIELH